MGNALAFAAYEVIAKKQAVPKLLNGRVDIVTKRNAGKYIPWGVRNKQALTVRFAKQGSAWYFRTTPDYGVR
jgi:hypothetical protein